MTTCLIYTLIHNDGRASNLVCREGCEAEAPKKFRGKRLLHGRNDSEAVKTEECQLRGTEQLLDSSRTTVVQEGSRDMDFSLESAVRDVWVGIEVVLPEAINS